MRITDYLKNLQNDYFSLGTHNQEYNPSNMSFYIKDGSPKDFIFVKAPENGYFYYMEAKGIPYKYSVIINSKLVEKTTNDYFGFTVFYPNKKQIWFFVPVLHWRNNTLKQYKWQGDKVFTKGEMLVKIECDLPIFVLPMDDKENFDYEGVNYFPITEVKYTSVKNYEDRTIPETWLGRMTKAIPFDNKIGFELNRTLKNEIKKTAQKTKVGRNKSSITETLKDIYVSTDDFFSNYKWYIFGAYTIILIGFIVYYQKKRKR